VVLNSAISNILVEFCFEFLNNFIIAFKGSFKVWYTETTADSRGRVSQRLAVIDSADVENAILIVIFLACHSLGEHTLNLVILRSKRAFFDTKAISENVSN